MTQSWSYCCKKFALASDLAMGGAITLTGCFAISFTGALWAIASLEDCALAQIIPDSTLGNENSTVTSTGTVDQIDAGVTKGTNLFHSFQEFNISNGRSAFFSNPPGIENILSRVTGANPSNILGTLGVSGGNANLFLINPNGIIFGQNARLSLNGSFVATTANAIGLVNGDIFSANPVEPLPSQLLNVNPNAFFFNQIAAQPIINRSTANSTGLRVPQGQSLLLLGGAVRLEGGQMQAPGGRVELGGVAGIGTVGLSVNGNDLRLSFPVGVLRADVSLDNSAQVDVRAGGGGSIAINARNLDIFEGSAVIAGIGEGLGSASTQAGNIDIYATEQVTIAGKSPTGSSSGIANSVDMEAIGNGGDINIQAWFLTVRNGAQLAASTFGRGDAGSVRITASDSVSFDGNSAAFSVAEAGSVGNGGNIDITTRSLRVLNGAQLQTLTVGRGDAGSVRITATDSVSFDGRSAVFSSVEVGAVGNGGNIDITTRSLSVTNGSQLIASTYGQGDAGSVKITATDSVSFDRETVAYSTVEEGAVGNGGSINITTRSLRVTDDALLSANTYGQGNGGTIDITTGSLSVTNGAQLLTLTQGQGNAGSVRITATDSVFFDREGAAFSSVGAGAVGNGGSIDITTGSLSVTNGAQLLTLTRGQGNAGSVRITATNSVSFDRESAAFSSVGAGAVGNGGDIDITTESLTVRNGSQLIASTYGQGDAGSVRITATDSVSFDGVGNEFPSAAYSTVEAGAVGNGGGIDITTGLLRVTNGAVLSASTRGQGNGGNIDITSGSLKVTNGSQLQTLTEGRGNAGSVRITATDSVSFDGVSNGFPSAVSSSAQPQAEGNGGNIDIKAGSLRVINGALLTVSSRGNGAAGNLVVEANSIRLDNQAHLSANTVGGAGNINLRSRDLVLSRGSNITTNAKGINNIGGNITIDTDILAAIENSDISANSEDFRGGQVIINAQGIIGTQFRDALTRESDITATGGSPELSGTVEINTQNVDPNAGLFALPVQPADSELAQGCQAGGGQEQSKFVVIGRGGLPPNPKEALSSDDVVVNWISLTRGGENPSSPAVSTKATNTTPAPLVEAQGWVMNNKGQVVLTASVPTVTPHSPWQTSNSCGTPQSEARSGD